MGLPALNELPPMQAAFVQHLLKGESRSRAAELAGYTDYVQSGTKLLNSPAVIAAMHAGIQTQIQADAAVNLKVLHDIRDDKNAPARVRADIGVKLLGLAGHIQPRGKNDGPQKAISEMSQAELLSYIDENQAAIDKAEAELMAKAKDVSPGAGVTADVPKQGAQDAKGLDYLD